MQHKEDDLQIAVMDYLRLQYPKAFAMHVGNGGKRNIREAARLKRMGVTKGVSDILILHGNNAALELKIKPNKPTPEQLRFLEKVKELGWSTSVCYDFDSAKEFIDKFFD